MPMFPRVLSDKFDLIWMMRNMARTYTPGMFYGLIYGLDSQ